MDHNYGICSDQNRIIVGKGADIFGLSWMSDDTTIYRMTLVKNIVICADVPPTVVDIRDCADHMAAGDKKDAEYLAGVMEEKIVKFDPERMHTAVFYFDGLANVQNGCLSFCALYPIAYVFCGGEHFISLFFMILQR